MLVNVTLLLIVCIAQLYCDYKCCPFVQELGETHALKSSWTWEKEPIIRLHVEFPQKETHISVTRVHKNKIPKTLLETRKTVDSDPLMIC